MSTAVVISFENSYGSYCANTRVSPCFSLKIIDSGNAKYQLSPTRSFSFSWGAVSRDEAPFICEMAFPLHFPGDILDLTSLS